MKTNTLISPRRLVLACTLLFVGTLHAIAADPSATTSQLTQYGITWTFAAPVEYGQFVNGDYWVVGPVTVSSVSPGWDGSRNGSMIDPVPLTNQGFDSRIDAYYTFSEASRVKFPITISGTKSLLSAISLAQNKIGGAYQALSDMAVLTIVSSAPLAGSFRPAFVSGAKKIWNISEVNYSLVPTLPIPPGVTIPDLSNVMRRINPYFGQSSWGPVIIPENNVFDVYPAYENIVSSQLALEAMLNIPQKKEYINRLVQRGIDHYAISLLNDRGWECNGGYGVGLKWPILFAGLVLGDSGMQAPPRFIPSLGNGSNIFKFPEDGYTYLGAATTTHPAGKPMFGIDYASLGYSLANCLSNCMARDPAGLLDPENRPYGGGYRTITSPFWVGQTLAVHLMNAKAIWRHDLYFDYIDRWLTEPQTWFDTTGTKTDFWGYGDETGMTQALWRTYRTTGAPAPVITSATNAFGATGSAFNYIIAATYFPTSYSATGLPAGLSINTTTGVISGIPSTATTTTVTLGATNPGGTGTASLTLNVSPPDGTAPTAPANLVGSATSTTQIALSWNAATDNIAVAGYSVYRNNTLTGNSSTTTYADSGLSAASTYAYSVSAYDGAGNTSARSTAINVATLPAEIAPAITSQPQSLTTVSTGASFNLSVTATGTGLVYTWRKDASPIAGASQSTYSVISTNTSHAGTYTVIVSNTTGSVTSKNAVVQLAGSSPSPSNPTPSSPAAPAKAGSGGGATSPLALAALTSAWILRRLPIRTRLRAR